MGDYRNPDPMSLMPSIPSLKRPIVTNSKYPTIGLGSSTAGMQSYNQGMALGKGGTSMLGTTDPALNNNLSLADTLKGYGKEAMSYMPDTGITMENAFGENGFAMPLLSGLGSLASGWAALGQYGVAKDSLEMQKDAFNKNYVAQGRLTNAQLADQQTRNLGNMSPERQAQALTADDYVKKYGVANV